MRDCAAGVPLLSWDLVCSGAGAMDAIVTGRAPEPGEGERLVKWAEASKIRLNCWFCRRVTCKQIAA